MLTNIPTPIKKNGIKREWPTNSIRFIKAEVWGIKRLRVRPAKKEPIMGSIPANWAKKQERNTMASTKIYCEMGSSNFLKNHRTKNGKPNHTKATKRKTDKIN